MFCSKFFRKNQKMVANAKKIPAKVYAVMLTTTMGLSDTMSSKLSNPLFIFFGFS